MRETVLDGLARNGYVVLRGTAYPAFRALCDGLGTVVATGEIAIKPGVAAYACQPAAVPPHTDHPAVDIIGWWCERQDGVDGASIVVDGWRAIDAVDPKLRPVLRRVMVEVPPLEPGDVARKTPLLSGEDGTPRIYFAPWYAPASVAGDEGHALTAFTTALGAARTAEVPLKSGDALLVDNHRILHARGAIDAASPRRLRRIWMKR